MQTHVPQRAIFPPAAQREFLEKVQEVLGTEEMAKLSNCSERTIRDWRREKFHMTIDSIRALCKKSRIPLPSNFTSRYQFAHTKEAGRKGGRAVIDTFGKVPVNEEFRKEKWRKWWDSSGKYLEQEILQPKPISIPEISPELAEYIGIMIGDGGITSAQATITLHHIDDLEYSFFVTELIEKLFSVKPSVYHISRHSVNSIVVSRVELVRHLQTLGLPVGNKIRQEVDIPDWIKEDPVLSIACVRGLVDTDGCIFTHSYISRGKRYSYKKLDFTSASASLRKSVFDILQSLGMHPRMSRTTNVRLERIEDVTQYFALIGSHNPKHLNRFAS